MDSIASQAQDAVNPEKQKKRKAAEAKVKTGSSLLQKLGELFGTIANTDAPVARMEGEPFNELNQQSNQMPGVNATTPQPTQPAPTPTPTQPTPTPVPQQPAPTQTTHPSQQAPTPAPQPTPTPAPQPTPQPQQAPQPTPNAQDNVNPQPAPVQQTPPPTNNAMNGGQLFQLVQQLRNNGNNFRVFNAATNKVEYSTDGNSAYIINGNLLYPNKTSRSKTLDINPAVFDVNTKLIDDTSSITPATVDQGGFITQKGIIG
jgi:DNA polymerase III gamma/tau subunit